MSERASLTLRWTRAVLLGAVALATGAGAHLSAAGRLPGPSGLLLLTLLCTAGAAFFLGREASATRLVVLVVAGQAVVHTGLSAIAGHRGETNTAGPATSFHPTSFQPGSFQPGSTADRSGSYFDQWAQTNPAAHLHDGSGAVLPSWLVHAVTDVLHQPAMAGAHVLAAVLVGLWLAVGERALWTVLALTGAWALRVVAGLSAALDSALPVTPRPRPVRPTAYPASRKPRISVRSRPVRRGPPVLLTAH